MKIYYKRITAALLCALVISPMCLAEGKVRLSPALEILEKQTELKKCALINTSLEFSAKEFEEALSIRNIDYITVTSLPQSEFGTLKAQNLPVLENQTLSKKSIGLLCFVPNENTVGCSVFEFTANDGENDISAKCVINVLDEINLAPAVSSMKLETYKNISAFKTLSGSDPEDDAVCFEIVEYPKKGSVKILDEETGSFVYTPYENKKGNDSFCFVAVDQYGNRSERAEVEAFIENKSFKTVLSDMDGHWANISALKICDMGLMTPTKQADGKNVFCPDEVISRGDFLAMAMIVTGNEKNVNLCYATTFADDSTIPANIKSYAESALAMGIVTGYSENGASAAMFGSDKAIKRSEAAVILNRLSKAPTPIINPRARDAAALPTWAQDSVYSLMANGILNGNEHGEINPDKPLSRAEAAQLLCNAADYVERKNQEEKPKKSIFNLFGLIK